MHAFLRKVTVTPFLGDLLQRFGRICPGRSLLQCGLVYVGGEDADSALPAFCGARLVEQHRDRVGLLS
jgi:hypothetical protein